MRLLGRITRILGVINPRGFIAALAGDVSILQSCLFGYELINRISWIKTAMEFSRFFKHPGQQQSRSVLPKSSVLECVCATASYSKGLAPTVIKWLSCDRSPFDGILYGLAIPDRCAARQGQVDCQCSNLEMADGSCRSKSKFSRTFRQLYQDQIFARWCDSCLITRGIASFAVSLI